MTSTRIVRQVRLLTASSVLALGALTFCAGAGMAQVTGSGNSHSYSNSSTTDSGNSSSTVSNSGNSSVSGSGNSHSYSSASGNTMTGSGNSHSNSSATGGSVTGSGNSNANGTNTQSFVQNDYTPSTQTIKNVPNVYAPGLAAAGAEVCLGSVSAGGAGAGFGVTFGGTYVDQECQLRLNAKTLATLGYIVAAREEMCLDPQVRAAMYAAGTPCAADRAAEVVQARDTYVPPAAPARPVALNLPANAAQPAEPPAPAGCHKEYQLLGGWYDVCPGQGR